MANDLIFPAWDAGILLQPGKALPFPSCGDCKWSKRAGRDVPRDVPLETSQNWHFFCFMLVEHLSGHPYLLVCFARSRKRQCFSSLQWYSCIACREI